jgi:putative FmdB family regulatory protein
MAIYVYRCENGHEVERYSKEYRPRIICPTCGKPADKIPATTNFILKGGGWYKDGYSKKNTDS